MSHHLYDVALGMLLGYALARGYTHLHEESPLSKGADAMAEGGMQRHGDSATAPTPRPGALYPGGSTAAAPTPRF